MSPYINPDFEKAVINHIVGNLLIKNSNSPLILGIFGPPGEGKTFQLKHILDSLNIQEEIISPGELENENAGYPAQLLRRSYLRAGASIPSRVLVINDIDTVLGNWGELVQYTVNRQTLYGQLMSFCDYPTEVNGQITKRIPIIVTGNNPDSLYQPLLRSGRMRRIIWEPSVEDKIEIVSRIFHELSPGDIRTLVLKYKTEPVSFWSDARAFIWENQVGDWVAKKPKQQIISMIQNQKTINMNLNGQQSVFSNINTIFEACEILHDIQTRNYLK